MVTPKQRVIDEIAGEVRAYQRAVDTIDEIVTERAGVNRTDGRCCDLLDQYGRMTAGELARKAGLTTGGVTTVLDRLERAGLARRVEDPADRRRVLVERTPAAERFAADAFGPLVAASQTVMQRYSTEELELILDFLRRSRAVTEAHAVALRAADLAPPQGDVAPGNSA